MMCPSGDEENNNSRRRSSSHRKSCYRKLLNKVEEIQESDDLSIETVKSVKNLIKEANALDSECKVEDRLDQPEEILLDCIVLSSASSVLKKCIESVDVFSYTYEPAKFATKIIQEISETDELEPTDLLKLLDDARNIIPTVPDYNYVYGSYDLNQLPAPKEKKVRAKVQKEKLQKKEPEKITVGKEEEGIEEIVKFLEEVLKIEYEKNDCCPIKYYDYVIDTDDFSCTVENMFYCSFLIRDGKAEINLDKNGNPIIKPMKRKKLQEFRTDGGVNAQIITTITFEEWQKLKKAGFLQLYKKNQKKN